MSIKKTLTILLIMASVSLVKSQNKIVLSLNQNLNVSKLDLLAKIELQERQKNKGYFSAVFEFQKKSEYKRFYRYTLNCAYTFKDVILKNSYLGASVGYGFIDNNQRSYTGLNGNIFFKYPVLDNLRLCFNAVIVNRKDLNKIKTSAFLGVEIKLN